jgi:hypothetical protein
MKTPAIFIVLFALFSSTMTAAEDDTKTFGEHFYDEENIPTYVALIDDLIVAGEARIYASMDDERKDPNAPGARTSNGILMLYTVTHTPDGVLVHFSTSRAPYLATPFGKHIVGLFMYRSGWPKPTVFSISENRVFHAIWMIPEAQFTQIQATLPELRATMKASENPKAAFVRALLRSGDLQEQPKQPAPAAAAPVGRGVQ